MIHLKEWNNKEGFDLMIDGQCMAVSNYYWRRRPTIKDKQVSAKEMRRQIYITGVESFKIGCGTLLMQSIIEHFTNRKNTKKCRLGYSLDYLWLSVTIDNHRAIGLYKKCGFEIDEVHGVTTTDTDEPHYMMYKKR